MGDGPLDHTHASKEATEMGPHGDSSPDPKTASLSMASTIDDLLACRGFGEAVEEWDPQSQQCNSPTNEDGVGDIEEHHSQSGQRREPAETTRQQPQPPAFQ